MLTRTLALVVSVAAICGCGAAELDEFPYEAGVSGPRSGSHEVFDGFETRTGWVVDGADDRARLTRSNARATEGSRSLHVVPGPGSRRKVSIRRDVSVDLSGVRSVAVDAWTGVEGFKLAMAFVTQPGFVYHETTAAKLPVGWNTISFRLDGPHMKTAETRWQHEAVLANAGSTLRVVFVLYTGGVEGGEVFLDGLSFEGPPSGPGARFPPANVHVHARSVGAKLHGTLEVEVSFEASHGSPFDPREIRVFADFRTPSGEVRRVPGFVTSTSGGAWRVRYMPLEPGRHSYQAGVENRLGRTTTLPRSFLVEGESPVPPVRVSARDARQFEHVTGEPFYPVGMNVAWASDFRPYFEKFAAAGGNLVRVWLAPWSLPVASRREAGEVDLDAADQLAEVFGLARRAGLKVQLVFAYHGEFLEGWKESPYSAANGGPCAVPGEFFSGPRARAAFRRLLRYVAARFATEPALFAWELFNEVDLAPALDRRDVIEWHREMAAYLRSVDHTGRLVTTSTARIDSYPELDALDGIDFLQAHVYGPDVDAAVLGQVTAHSRSGKPAFIGEFGGGARGTTDQLDTDGVRLRAGLWLSLASPASGTALPWWWDTQIEPNNLYRNWIPVAVLARRIDRRGKRFRFVHEALARVAESRAAVEMPDSTVVHGILTRTEGLLYFYDRRALESFVVPPNVLPEGARLTVHGLVDGAFDVEFWEGTRREPSRRLTTAAEDGRLVLELPASPDDFAVYFKAARAPEPGIAR